MAKLPKGWIRLRVVGHVEPVDLLIHRTSGKFGTLIQHEGAKVESWDTIAEAEARLKQINELDAVEALTGRRAPTTAGARSSSVSGPCACAGWGTCGRTRTASMYRPTSRFILPTRPQWQRSRRNRPRTRQPSTLPSSATRARNPRHAAKLLRTRQPATLPSSAWRSPGQLSKAWTSYSNFPDGTPTTDTRAYRPRCTPVRRGRYARPRGLGLIMFWFALIEIVNQRLHSERELIQVGKERYSIFGRHHPRSAAKSDEEAINLTQ